MSKSTERVDELVETKVEELNYLVGEVNLTEQEVRDFTGVLHPKGTDAEKIKALDAQAEHFRLEALREDVPEREAFLKGVSETAELKADSIRLKMGLGPEHEETKSIVDEEKNNDDLGRLERFKQWARRNLGEMSAVAISVAGIITAVVVSVRNAVSAVAKTVSKVSKELAKLAKKAGPLVGGIANLFSKIVSLGSRIVTWLAGHLWVLAVALVLYVYERIVIKHSL